MLFRSDIPLAYARTLPQSQQPDFGAVPLGNLPAQKNEPVGQKREPQKGKKAVTDAEIEQLDGQIQKAAAYDADIVPIMLEIRKALKWYQEKAGE